MLSRTGYAFLVAAFTVLFGSGASADDCDTVLTGGVFDRLEVRNNVYSKMVVARQLSQMTAQQARQRVQAGLTMPVEGVPVTGNFSDDQFNSWAQSVSEAFASQQTHWDQTSISQMTASPAILQAWSNCKEAARGLIARLESNDPRNMVFRIRYAPQGSVTRAKIITGLAVTGGRARNNQEAAQLAAGKFITSGGLALQITREDARTPVTITINTEEGSADRYVPAIVEVPRFPAARIPNPNKWYRITSGSTGWHLNVFAGRYNSVAQPLCVAQATPPHLWKFIPASDAYQITSKESPGTAVGRITRDNTVNAGIVQGVLNDDTQRWVLEPTGSGRYLIKARGGNVYIALGAEGTPPHKALKQAERDSAEEFILTEQGDID